MGTGCTKTKEDPIKVKQYNKNLFDFKKIIGKGGFGRVWKVYALKVMDKAKIITKKSVNSVLNEKQILCKLEHQFIVNMHCAFQDRQNLYLVMDYLDGGDLRYYINRHYSFTEDQIKFVIRCIMEGLKYLHENNIIHRDIKPENIILDKKGYCRITDMGVARYWKAENSHQTSGTPGYMAPEVLLRQNHSFCVDYFAVGIIAYELAMGKRPYSGRQRKQIRDQMLSRQAKIPASFKGISMQGIDFINKMIQRHAKKRLGYDGIDDIMNHPWLNMNQKDLQNFYQVQMPSPIIPLQISFHPSLQDYTEPDEIWRQNILLLKQQSTQKLFFDYDFTPQMKYKLQSITNCARDSQLISIKDEIDKSIYSFNTKTTIPQIQDTISFPSTRRYKNSSS